MQIVTWLTLVGFYKGLNFAFYLNLTPQAKEATSTILKPKKVVSGKDVFNAKKLRHDWLQAKKNLTKCEEREKGIFADINTLCSNVNDSIGFMHHRVTKQQC